MTRKPTHPGILFNTEVLQPTNTPPYVAADAMEMSSLCLIAICSGMAPVTQGIAEKMAAYTGTTAESWLRMQTNLDEWQALQ